MRSDSQSRAKTIGARSVDDPDSSRLGPLAGAMSREVGLVAGQRARNQARKRKQLPKAGPGQRFQGFFVLVVRGDEVGGDKFRRLSSQESPRASPLARRAARLARCRTRRVPETRSNQCMRCARVVVRACMLIYLYRLGYF